MTLVGTLQARLEATGLTVLPPERLQEPLSGRRPGEGGGLSVFLSEHPDGYVQLEQPLPITAEGHVAHFWVTVAAIATTEAACAELAEQVRRSLTGHPVEPGPHDRVLADQPRPVNGRFYLCRPTYQIVEIDGQTAV